jgi:ribosomal protein S18 acetylase RimI-like enzyme
MDDQKVSFSIKSYKDNEHIRILNSVLSKWLTDPKILHFTAPKIQYPYKINNWISTSYNDENTHTYTIEIDNWIIGHLSAKLSNETKSAHLFHLIIDENHRKKGFAKKLIDYVEKKNSN